jgi:hypothetical protein
VEHIILAINHKTFDRRANNADVIVACAQVLGQSIALAGSKEVATEIRQGIMALIDGYAMEVATTQGDAAQRGDPRLTAGYKPTSPRREML